MADETKKSILSVRIPVHYKEILEIIAQSETRSVTQQVEHFLKEAIKEYSIKSNDDRITHLFYGP